VSRFAFTIFLSAFLLFLLEPAITKAVLPWFGGTPAVWTSALLFFQAVLVAGYGYAEVVARLRPRAQALVHGGLVVAAALVALPLAVDASRAPQPAEDPTLQILALLGSTVGLPFFVLSSTSPLLQAWAARAEPERSPYPLYALSNLGSLLGLAAYPFLIEPRLTVAAQLRWWSVGFAAFAAATVLAALAAGAAPVRFVERARDGAGVRARGATALWIVLPACGSVFLLAVTNRICREVAVIPFLWVLPLAIYLATFIACFASDRAYRRGFFLPALFVISIPVAFGLADHNLGIAVVLGFHVALLFVACMVCHGELARLRPEPARLTSYYLASSAGSAAGAAFVALAAPRLFATYFELPLSIILALALPPVVSALESRERFRSLRWGWFLWIQATAAIAALLWYDTAAYRTSSIMVGRNFFGTLRVYEQPGKDGAVHRIFAHGATTHGVEFTDPSRRRLPTGYYGEGSGAARGLSALDSGGPRRLGVVGLGIGMLAAYARPGDEIWFYEINPLVVDVARSDFHYLADTPATVHIELGDGRLVLEASPPRRFDALFADAFSSDAVPTHLLTLEAFRLYFRHLRPGGLLAVDLSNRALDLRPVIAAAARALDKDFVFVHDRGDASRAAYATVWALLSDDRDLIEGVRASLPPRKKWVEREILWTDDFTSLLPLLK